MGPKRNNGNPANNGNNNVQQGKERDVNRGGGNAANRYRNRNKGPGGGGTGRSYQNHRANRTEAGVEKASSTGRTRLVSECGEDGCPVCLGNMAIKHFAVGICNHPVCAECSTRMRVLCVQNECPICRQDMPKVVMTKERTKFEDVENEPFKVDRKYKICFENDHIQEYYHSLLEHRCGICKEDENGMAGAVLFRSFKQLDQHMKRTHELYFCDLCVGHLKIFTHERRLYSRPELATHRRKGDPDDKSHRGHPLCEFCENRFVDKDELFRHLRREHFFCHFCEADGVQHYYEDYTSLSKHFGTDHFLCLEGDCRDEQFTHAFRTEIDLKAHRAERHSEGFTSKAAAKQNRVVELEINYSRHHHNRRRGGRDSPGAAAAGDDTVDGIGQQNNAPPSLTADSFPTLLGGETSSLAAGGGQSKNLAKKVAMSSGHNVKWSEGRRMPSEQDFPSLPGTSASPVMTNRSQPTKSHDSTSKVPPEDFPSLSGSGSAGGLTNFRPASAPIYRKTNNNVPVWSSQEHQQKRGARSKVPAPAPIFDDEDATLNKPPTATVSSSKMITLKKAEKKTSEIDFPALETSAPVGKAVVTDAPSKAAKKKKAKVPGVLDDLKREQKEQSSAGGGLQSVANVISVGASEKTEPSEWSTVKLKEQPSQNETNKKESKPNADNIPGLSFRDPEPEISGPPKLEKNAAKPRPSTIAEDFPSLGPSSGKMSANFRSAESYGLGRTNGVISKNPHKLPGKAPPPGFGPTADMSKPASASRAPPGFASRSKIKSNAVYQQPDNFGERNRQLLSSFSLLFGGKSLEFSEFKSQSTKFRSGKVSSKEYYDYCLDSAGNKTFNELLPELVALLPDIKKQNELLSIHEERFPESKLGLSACPDCGQLLMPMDSRGHNKSHVLDTDFPRLG